MTRKLRTLIAIGTISVMLSPAAALAGSADDGDFDRVLRQVQRKISGLYGYGVFDHITFTIEGPMVTLDGQVSRPALMKSAVKVLMRLEGVDEVVNNLEVLPNSREDDRIRRRVYENVYGHSVLSRYNPQRGTPFYPSQVRRQMGVTYDPPVGPHAIHIVVSNGHVTLQGMVANAGDRTIAELQANATRGVFSVTNNLQTH